MDRKKLFVLYQTPERLEVLVPNDGKDYSTFEESMHVAMMALGYRRGEGKIGDKNLHHVYLRGNKNAD